MCCTDKELFESTGFDCRNKLSHVGIEEPDLFTGLGVDADHRVFRVGVTHR